MEQEKVLPEQFRAARGLLNMSQENLAERAGFSSMTIKRAEGICQPQPSAEALAKIRVALETAGIVFLSGNGNGPGVALRKVGA